MQRYYYIRDDGFLPVDTIVLHIGTDRDGYIVCQREDGDMMPNGTPYDGIQPKALVCENYRRVCPACDKAHRRNVPHVCGDPVPFTDYEGDAA